MDRGLDRTWKCIFSLTIGNVIGRISTKLSIYINNDIQADIFDKIIDADWMEINQYSNGDVLNRFNSDVNTISGNAISWLPTIIIAVYDFVATFAVIWHYDKDHVIIGICKCTIYAFDVEVPYFQAERIWEESAGNE